MEIEESENHAVRLFQDMVRLQNLQRAASLRQWKSHEKFHDADDSVQARRDTVVIAPPGP